MSSVVIQFSHLSKRYRLGVIGTGTLAHDLNRWWARVRGRPDPTLKVGQAQRSDVRSQKSARDQKSEISQVSANAALSAPSSVSLRTASPSDLTSSPASSLTSDLRPLTSDISSSLRDDEMWALRDVSFEVQRGEVLGIIGANGAGKSTLLKILSRVTAPTAGEARVKGRIASLLEVGTGFHPELTGRENVYLNGAILGMTRAEIAGKFDEIVDFSGIEQFIDTPVKRYSSGMHVRLAFAIAAHLEPEILLVDEVLAVGDLSFQQKCLGKMQSVAGKGRTIIFVSHNMAAVEALCTRIVLLDKGRLSCDGEPEDVIRQYINLQTHNIVVPTGDRTDRQGNGALRFLKLSLQNKYGDAITEVLSGQTLRIAVDYGVVGSFPAESIDVHVTFRTLAGAFMFTCAMQAVGFVLHQSPSDGCLWCEIPRLPLTPGRYSLTLYATVNGQTADWVKDAGFLLVAAGDFFGTGKLVSHNDGFLVDHTWSAETRDPPLRTSKAR